MKIINWSPYTGIALRAVDAVIDNIVEKYTSPPDEQTKIPHSKKILLTILTDRTVIVFQDEDGYIWLQCLDITKEPIYQHIVTTSFVILMDEIYRADKELRFTRMHIEEELNS